MVCIVFLLCNQLFSPNSNPPKTPPIFAKKALLHNFVGVSLMVTELCVARYASSCLKHIFVCDTFT
jgi:hypothetical protein